jgi:hypothetical protein
MNMEKTEKEIKQLFSELKAQDSQRAPSFDAVMCPAPSSASMQRMSYPWFRFALGTTATVLLIGTIALTTVRLRERSLERERQQSVALSGWEAPTDAFLSISSLPWGGTVTTPSDFLINNQANSSDKTQENL